MVWTAPAALFFHGGGLPRYGRILLISGLGGVIKLLEMQAVLTLMFVLSKGRVYCCARRARAKISLGPVSK
jgi:hypothetical protein